MYFSKGYYWKNKILFKRSAKRAEVLTTVSNYSAERIKEKFNLKDKRIFILPNAVDEKFTLKRDKERDKKYIKQKYNVQNYILFVSRLEPRKNHISLLKAYENLSYWENNIELVFIGKRAINDKKLENAIKKVSIKSKNRVHHLSSVDDYDLLSFYNGAKVCVFPSICEGFGIPPLESAILQVPTICSNKTAMADFEFFSDNHIQPNEKEIKNRLKEIINKGSCNDNQLGSISKHISSIYNWKETSNRLISILKD